jgi:O-antigen/teichoic acid export membrane protein
VEGLRSQLIRGGLGSIAIKAVHIVLTFSLSIALARVLGAEGFGIYSYTFALVAVFAIPTQMGIPTLLIRETARNHAAENWAAMLGIWRWSNIVVVLLSFAIVAVVAAIITLVPSGLQEHRVTVLLIALALVPIIALGRLRDAALRGLRHIVAGQLQESVFRPAVFIALLFVFLFAMPTRNISPADAMAMHVCAAILAVTIGAFVLKKAWPEQLRMGVTPTYRHKEWLSSALPLALIAGLQLIVSKTDIIMLGALKSDREVGVYQAVIQMSLLGGIALEIVQMLIGPYVSRFHGLGDKASLQKIVKLGSQSVFIATIPVLILFALIGGDLLGLLFGGAFIVGGTALVILAFGRFASASFGPVGMVLQMTGFEKETVVGVVTAALANVFLNLLLIPLYGLEGAAIATACALTISHAILYRFVRLRLGLETSALPSRLIS